MFKLRALALVVGVAGGMEQLVHAESPDAMPVRRSKSPSSSRNPLQESVTSSGSPRRDAPPSSSRPPASTPSGKKGLLTRILPAKPEEPVFNTDYRTRSSGAVVPTGIQGRGLSGKNIPLGEEDAYRSSLPADFCPTDLVRISPDLTYSSGQPIFLRHAAAASLERMFRDAAAEGHTLRVFSGYRDYAHQSRLYAEAVRKGGQNQTSVARPGRSEHFLGTTADVTNGNKRDLLSRSFAQSPEGKWLERNAARYGWKMTVRAGEGKRSHADEPWHIRYLGGGKSSPAPVSKPSLLQRLGRVVGIR